MFAGVLEAAKLYCQSDKGGVSNDIEINIGGHNGGQIISIINLFWLIDILTWILPSSSPMTEGRWFSLHYWVSSR